MERDDDSVLSNTFDTSDYEVARIENQRIDDETCNLLYSKRLKRSMMNISYEGDISKYDNL